MLEGRYASVTPRKYEIFPYFSQKHFEICPNMCNFALEIRKHFEVWMQIIAYSKCYTQILWSDSPKCDGGTVKSLRSPFKSVKPQFCVLIPLGFERNWGIPKIS